MNDEFLIDCLITYIERKITEKFNTNYIINKFYDMKERHTLLKSKIHHILFIIIYCLFNI